MECECTSSCLTKLLIILLLITLLIQLIKWYKYLLCRFLKLLYFAVSCQVVYFGAIINIYIMYIYMELYWYFNAILQTCLNEDCFKERIFINIIWLNNHIFTYRHIDVLRIDKIHVLNVNLTKKERKILAHSHFVNIQEI